MDAIEVTVEQLVEGLRALRSRGSVRLSLELLTDQSAHLRGRDNPYRGRLVQKRFRLEGGIGPDYEGAVNRRLERLGEQPTFQAGKAAWGERIEDAFAQYGDRLYLIVHEGSRGPESYLVDGLPVETSDILPHLRTRPEPVQEVGTDGRPVRPVLHKRIALDSIVSVTYGGQTYIVRQSTPAPATVVDPVVAEIEGLENHLAYLKDQQDSAYQRFVRAVNKSWETEQALNALKAKLESTETVQ